MDVDERCSDDDEDDFGDDYYRDVDDDLTGDECDPTKCTADAENADFECLSTIQVEHLLNEAVASVVDDIGVAPDLAKALLNSNQWNKEKVGSLMRASREETLIACGMCPKPQSSSSASSTSSPSSSKECSVCSGRDESMRSLVCEHAFCTTCWRYHIETRLMEGFSSRIECMQFGCTLVCPAEFALSSLNVASQRARYEKFVFRDYVNTHPALRFCVGKDCQVVIRSQETLAKRVVCSACSSTFCVLCGGNYHAPTSCDTIKMWLTKCADDSETANYISAHTKDCPQCHSCIEKNGGCNHMQCAKCKHHFCWMCFGDWKTHGSEYYECSRYKENPEVAAEANHMKARRALEKYLHYFERYENHSKSLRMEEEMRERLGRRINDRVSGHEGTWIDWQYLYEAASLLTRCRYTLQYTYPFAYYMEASMRKTLFEHQQGQLEKEVEELAWAIERADEDCKGTLQAHMHRAEMRRRTLLHDFFFSPEAKE